MTTNGESDGRRTRLDWRGRLSGVLLGAAGGMGVTALSSGVGYRGVAAATAAGAVLSAVVWLRRQAARVGLVREVTRVLLFLASAGVVVAAFGPASWAAHAVLAVTALTLAVALVRSAGSRLRLLLGVAVVGAGVAATSAGVPLLTRNVVLTLGMAAIGLGLAATGFGVAVLVDDRVAFGTALLSGAVALIGGSIATMVAGAYVLGDVAPVIAALAVTAAGLGLLGQGVAALAGNRLLGEVAVLATGAAVIGGGVTGVLTDSHLMPGVLGMAVIGVGVTVLLAAHYATPLGLGVAVISIGVTALADHDSLRGVMAVSIGVACIGIGASVRIAGSGGKRLRTWIAALTRNPEDEQSTPAGPEVQVYR